MTKLKPCPYCGAESVMKFAKGKGYEGCCTVDKCVMSEVLGGCLTEYEAIIKYNARG